MGVPARPDSSRSLVVTRDASTDELTAVVHQAARAAFGATALIAEVVLRTLSESAAARSGQASEGSLPTDEAVDFVLGVGWGLAKAADRTVRIANTIASPAISVVLAPPLVPARFQPGRLLRRVSLAWKAERAEAVRSLYAWSATITPAANDLALNLVDLTPVVESVVRRMDLEEIVGTALDQLDLTDMVVERVDLQRVITSALEEIDLTQLVLDRVDLVKIADVIVDGVDLTEIIRDSTESMALETVHDVRLQGIEADRAVSRLVARVLHRREQP